ncbi:predicted protein [Lichtheimia corymbifera JMRC:FSU:9682]|uniref:Phosphatidic acid phosphatase type 2/haloperoxidase domain-containing protein n=1 Tax=Lichtheimia corymbifera JMRC:FSU:9682 TaxID=1263082 RepID=A0A068RUR4_9FUNG|nr:predicted protein [Lichtheimia corymbifera JMRC:FSU:9682]
MAMSLLRVLDKAQWLVISMSMVAVIVFGSLHLIYFFTGSILCAITAKILKHLIRQPRPRVSTQHENISSKTSYGMPSSHSQVMAFFATYCHCAVSYVTPLTIALASILYIFTAMVLWSRVRLGHHTLAQVSVGTLVGASMATMWHQLWQQHIMSMLP